MKNMKMGYIVQILKQDNLGVIREEGTSTEWLYFLDGDKLSVGTMVSFYRDEEFEQFVAFKVQKVSQFRSSRAV